MVTVASKTNDKATEFIVQDLYANLRQLKKTEQDFIFD
jgi:hypothetical protein